jgi:nucleoside-diphosphate-sugar epimerase
MAGGSDLIGRHLSDALLAWDEEVLVLSRRPASAHARLPGCAVFRWHPGSDGKWQDEPDVLGPRNRLEGDRQSSARPATARSSPGTVPE